MRFVQAHFANRPLVVVLTDDVPGVRSFGNESVGRMRLPTESIGTFTLTLTGLVVGSAIRVETQAGALIEFRVADASTEVFSVPVYGAGNPSNDLRIKVRKASGAPFYVPYQTLAAAFTGSQTIFVSQQPDE